MKVQHSSPNKKGTVQIRRSPNYYLEAAPGLEPGNNGFADRCLSLLAMPPFRKKWSGRTGSNRRRPPWQGGTLPLSYARLRSFIAAEYSKYILFVNKIIANSTICFLREPCTTLKNCSIFQGSLFFISGQRF